MLCENLGFVVRIDTRFSTFSGRLAVRIFWYLSIEADQTSNTALSIDKCDEFIFCICSVGCMVCLELNIKLAKCKTPLLELCRRWTIPLHAPNQSKYSGKVFLSTSQATYDVVSFVTLLEKTVHCLCISPPKIQPYQRTPQGVSALKVYTVLLFRKFD